jgi:dipeptidyl aminopeptidase/acylaminoacyl peptidase
MAPRAAAIAALVFVAACSDGTGPAPQGRIVEGVDLDAVFADPSAAEIAAVEAEWAARAPAATDVVVEKDSLVSIGDTDVRVRVVSHAVDDLTHYGAILQDDGVVGPAPILVYTHGGDEGTSLDEVLLLFPFLGDLAADFVWVVPSFRSEPLTFGDTTWTSDGPSSPWDRDVDDALSLLEVALELETAADAESVGVLGLSRGAGVGMLMGIRDPRIDRIVEFFGPTDFFGSYVQDVVEEALRGTLRDLPGLDYLNESYIQPLKRGEVTVAAVRTELVRRSVVLFADRLPTLQLHHGNADTVVDVSQAESLIAAMSALGRGEPDFEAYLYPAGTHNPLSMPGSVERTVDFLSLLLAVPAS